MIRLATDRDLPAIAAIYAEAVAHPFHTADLEPRTDAAWERWWAAHPPARYPVFVAEIGDDVVGWASLSAHRPGRAALVEVAEVSYYIAFAHHRKGFGEALVRHAMARARQRGYRLLYGLLIDGNTASIRLLEKLGFTEWGRLPSAVHVGEAFRDQVYMGRLLGAERLP